ncbi:hypothetical protein HYH03_016263 [Edaphochlamys debaryana]|uniref:Peptidase S8/S53 domain-containing protein n=1 Tax=Edaphochlamys debaryana TaxID=47281 RepID=A0A835XJI2_9CHLO|nr:hypothetical protein HYH03_016263 [Edaphochlamys debaryana]|eukprot:KAG2484966.1 hypothetical protein HYH03_016263 [Edaphochlamys debaryana]
MISGLLTAAVFVSLFGVGSATRALHGFQDGNNAMPAGGRADPPRVPKELLVQFRAGVPDDRKSAALGRARVDRVQDVHRGEDGAELILVRGSAADFDEARGKQDLESDGAVEFAEYNWVYTKQLVSDDPYFTGGQLWGMQGAGTSPPGNPYGCNAAAAWAQEYTGNGTSTSTVYIGVVDEGIQTTHPDLAANIWTNPFDPVDGIDNDGNGYVDDTNGWDFVSNDRTVYDGGNGGRADQHGTHVSGTIGGKGGNGVGVAGVTWNVQIISGKFLGRNGGTTADAVKAIDYFTDLKTRHGLDIVATSNSWGGGGFSQALSDAITRANASNILFIAAAGNGGADGVGDNNDATAFYPASYAQTNIISVAAITNTGAKSSFSNYGKVRVDLGAPGSGIWSTVPFNKYISYSGTSMATPHVAGAAALKAAHSSLTCRGAALRTAILSTVAPTPSLATTGPTPVSTGGRLDVLALMNYKC